MGRGRWVRLDPITPATDEPGLRKALELGLAVECRWRDGSDDRHCCDEHQAIRDRLEFLARTPAASDGSLDVERLARAMFHEHQKLPGSTDLPWAEFDERIHANWREAARVVAAEYARLSESPSEGQTE